MRLKKKKKNHDNKSNLNDLSLLVIPLSQKINALKEDKESYKKTLLEIEEEIKLYSEQILNIIDVGIILVDKENNIIYQNNWFKNNKILDLNLILSLEETNVEKKLNEDILLVNKQNYGDLSIYTISDITEIKKLEEEIALKKKLAYLGEMSAFIAHEFKNSLTAIKGFAAALKRKSDDPKIVKSVSKDIEEEVDYFHKILIDYLNYSKEIKLVKTQININKLLSNIINNMFKKENITINSEIETIFVDLDKIKQVLINLIKNSIEASPKNSLISIKITKVKDFVRIEIQDEGKGITDKDMEKIFNPFFTTKSMGTGLGTSISYQIIIAHNGRLYYKNREDKGVDTFIEIPVNKTQI